MTPVEMVAILLAGLAAGTINTVVGSGTLITFPTLLAFGVPPVTANVSNTVGLVPGLGVGRDRLPARAGRPARPGAAARRRPRCSAGWPARCCCWCCPPEAFAAIVPALIVLGCVLVVLQPRISARVAPRGTRRAGGCRSTARWWVWPAVARHRRVRRLLRRRAGRAADGGARASASTRPCSGSTPSRTCWPPLVNGVAGLSSSRSPTSTGPSPR